MDKMQKLIMVVPREDLLGEDHFEGFQKADKVDFYDKVLAKHTSMKRGDAETDSNFKQPIAYLAVVNPEDKTLFAYQRSSNAKDYTETRLYGLWSWGVGGHIDQEDMQGTDNPVLTSLKRELEEELDITDYDEPELIGYINSEADEVSAVHFGLVFVIKTSKKVELNASENVTGGFKTFDELERISTDDRYQVETWSAYILEPVKKHLGL